MLVVDGVELHLLDQVQEVGKLKGEHALGLQHVAEAGDERVQIGHVGQHVVGGHQVGAIAAGGEVLAGFCIEEHHVGAHADGAGRLRRVGRGLDAEHRDVLGQEVLQQVAVVARHLDDEGFRPQSQAFGHRLGIAPRMLDPARRERGEVGVAGIEDRLGRHLMVGLHQEAAIADPGVQREDRLVPGGELLGRQVAVGQRLQAEVEEGARQRRTAETAGGGGTHLRAS